jgi:hypothetical protein
MATRITKRNNAVKPASNNYIDQTRMTYGEKEPLKNLNSEVQNLDLPQQTPMPAAAPQPSQNVFAPTNQPMRPVEDGLPFGPGVGAQEGIDTTESLIQQFYDLTGDPLLARLIR